jgi:CheY-like chemotaxis protein
MRIQPSQAPEGHGGMALRRGPKAARRAASISVLVVEDDAADTTLIIEALKRHPDVSAAHAWDAADGALRLLAAGQMRPDLVLLDIHMPRIDGFEFLDRMRRIAGMTDVPVAFLTTSSRAQDAAMAKQSSATSYVIKPASYPELRARLDVVIQRAVAAARDRSP